MNVWSFTRPELRRRGEVFFFTLRNRVSGSFWCRSIHHITQVVRHQRRIDWGWLSVVIANVKMIYTSYLTLYSTVTLTDAGFNVDGMATSVCTCTLTHTHTQKNTVSWQSRAAWENRGHCLRQASLHFISHMKVKKHCVPSLGTEIVALIQMLFFNSLIHTREDLFWPAESTRVRVWRHSTVF